MFLAVTSTWLDADNVRQERRRLVNVDHVREVTVDDDGRAVLLWDTPNAAATTITLSLDQFRTQARRLRFVDR